MPDFNSNACAGFTDEDRAALWQAAKTLADEQALIVRIVQLLGNGAAWFAEQAANLGAELFGERWREKVTEATEQALWSAMDWATLGLDTQGEHAPWHWFNKAMTTATGTISGFFGLAGAAVDIPITTLMIMRSIAEIARANGEDLAADETKRACLQVLALGGNASDEDPEIAYWTARTALATAPMESVIKLVAVRLGIEFSEKLVAQAAPVAGALAGGTVNYMFMDYYQQIAGVHFVLRRLERKYKDPAGVRACFDNLVRQAKAQKQWKREKAEANA